MLRVIHRISMGGWFRTRPTHTGQGGWRVAEGGIDLEVVAFPCGRFKQLREA